jgi:hypothetical protein
LGGHNVAGYRWPGDSLPARLAEDLKKKTDIQEAPFILACSNIDYLRFGNVKFNNKSLTLCGQEQG